ncbi:MAG: hypothetical protein IJ958_04235 [Agathobacter sp.]|nr:hypothetical protein [Agathobacter sp.]
MAEAKKERNHTIYLAVKNGAKLKDLAQEYGVSSSLIRSVYEKEAKKIKRQQNPLYQLIEKYCDDEGFCTRTYTVLTRINATTAEEFMKLDRKYLLRYARNCGERMISLIEKIQADIKQNH